MSRIAQDPMTLLSIRSRSVAPYLLIAFLLIVNLSCAAEAERGFPPTVVFMTDLGTLDDSVAICKGVMYSIAPELRIIDLTHQVPPYSIPDGARFLYGATPYFPRGTVFVVVVDPGVGSKRKAIVAESKRGQYFVLPDNGLISLVEARDGIESVHEITNPGWMIGSKLSSTFHGRDIFSPVGAHIARGEDWTQVGPAMPVKELVHLDLKIGHTDERGLTGRIIAVDGPFGNLITNVDADEFSKLGYERGQEVPVRLKGKKMAMPFVKTFSDVPLQHALLYIDSRGRLAFAMNRGNFSKAYGVAPVAEFFIPRKEPTK